MIDDGKINAGMVENDDPFSKTSEKINPQQNMSPEVTQSAKSNGSYIKFTPNKPQDNKQETTKYDKSTNEKTKRKRKTRNERIEILKSKLNKKNQEADEIERQIKFLEMSPEERREEKRKNETRRKIIAGAVAIKMISENQIFNKESYKNALLSSIDREDDKEYFESLFK